MNFIVLKGLLRNITTSHIINDIEYNQADFITIRKNGVEDVLKLKFKKYSNKYRDGDIIELTGNIRSYSRKLADGKNKVDLYVFTYFDLPEISQDNYFELDGRICKTEDLRRLNNGNKNIHFTVANNLLIEDSNKKLNSYLPCVAWGKLADTISKLKVNTRIKIAGELHSREYKKRISDEDFEYRVAHELSISSIEVIEE